jgi:hypothetical protein
MVVDALKMISEETRKKIHQIIKKVAVPFSNPHKFKDAPVVEMKIISGGTEERLVGKVLQGAVFRNKDQYSLLIQGKRKDLRVREIISLRVVDESSSERPPSS